MPKAAYLNKMATSLLLTHSERGIHENRCVRHSNVEVTTSSSAAGPAVGLEVLSSSLWLATWRRALSCPGEGVWWCDGDGGGVVVPDADNTEVEAVVPTRSQHLSKRSIRLERT